METDNLLKEYKLTKLGLTPDEIKKPLIVVIYEQGCESFLNDVKFGALTNGCAAVFAPVAQIDSLNASMQAKEMLLPLREAVADLTETLLSLYKADGAAIVASSDICLAGIVMGAVRKNMPFAVMPVANTSSKHKDPLLLKSLVECGKMGLSSMEEELNPFSNRVDDFFSLAVFLEGAEASVARFDKENKTVLARAAGALAAKKTVNLSYPKKDFTLNLLNAGLTAHLNASGTCSSLLHIVAIARENGMDIDFEYVCSVASKINGLGYKLEVIKGSVAESGLVKYNAAQKPFKGQVRAYESEELARAAIFSGIDFSNTAIVITGQGPKNNGMPPLDIESALSAAGAENTVIITDGRLIEFGLYPIVCLLDKTESFDIIRTGDTIEIDFKKGKINANLGAKEVAARVKKLVASSKSATLIRYANSVSECSKGCVSAQTKPKNSF